MSSSKDEPKPTLPLATDQGQGNKGPLDSCLEEWRRLKFTAEDAEFNLRCLPSSYSCELRRRASKAVQHIRLAYAFLVAAKEEEQPKVKLF